MIKKILIIGAGIAGLTAAYWLHRYGFEVDIIEKSNQSPRGQGYLIDFWGAGFDVCEKMQLLDVLAKKNFSFDDFIFIDEHGKKESSFSIAKMQQSQKNRAFSLFRGDLEEALHHLVSSLLSVQTGLTVRELINQDNTVLVYFSNGTEKKYDLVIGADGTHSRTREQLFGREDQFSHYLGYQLAACIQRCDAPLPKSLHTYATVARQVCVCPVADNKVAVYYAYQSNEKKVDDPLNALCHAFSDAEWIIPDLIHHIKNTDNVFFDNIAQIRLPLWHKKRVVLLGDACQSLALTSGQGASMAMAGAYILSTLLSQHPYDDAVNQYQKIMQPGIAYKQQEAEKFLKSFVPESDSGISRRNFYTRHFFKMMYEKSEIERFCS